MNEISTDNYDMFHLLNKLKLSVNSSDYNNIFTYINMAEQPLKISELFQLIQENPFLSPPRTGHIGNWNDILDGYVAHRNDNTIICSQQKLGYPLVFDLTQTEDETLENGDLTYLPGSIIDKGERCILPLFSWNGTEFVERNRSESLFVPFLLTKRDDAFIPLSCVHRERYLKHKDKNITTFSTVFCENKSFVHDLLTNLIEYIFTTDDPQHELKFLIDRYITLSGQVKREAVIIDNHAFIIGESRYENISSFVDALLLPYITATEPDTFFSSIQMIPEHIPLLTNHFNFILLALLNTHFPAAQTEELLSTQSSVVHLQWGGIVMAGYPPVKSGYFVNQKRIMRRFYKLFLKSDKHLKPIIYILLPSSIFLLWPNKSDEQDVLLVEMLIEQILTNSENRDNVDDMSYYLEIEQIVKSWAAQAVDKLSPTFMKRFKGGTPPIFEKDGKYTKNIFAEPKSFQELTLQQASIVVGALFECFKILKSNE